MAALTTTTAMDFPVPDGQTKVRVYRVTIADQSATDQWIATGGEEVIAVLGVSPVKGTSGAGPTLSMVLNAQGTSATEGANPGDLGLETVGTADQIVDITVAYR